MPQAKRVTSISEVKDKVGRVDVLALGIAKHLLGRLEVRTQLSGLSEGILPIVEEEVRKHIPSSKMIPKEWEKLAQLIGKRINSHDTSR